MKRSALAFVVAILAVTALSALWMTRHRSKGAGAEQSLEEAGRTGNATEQVISYHVADPVPMGNQASVAQRLVDYRCHDEADCSSKPNIASSEIEARWLQSRGFPSPREEEALLIMPLAELDIRAKQGDLAALAILGSREISAGHVEQGLAFLHQASAKGSVYAAHQFAKAYATEDRIKDLTESMAYYRLAYLQGDWKAGASLYNEFPNASSVELTLADRRAMRLFGALMAIRMKGQQRISYGPRPFPDQG